MWSHSNGFAPMLRGYCSSMIYDETIVLSTGVSPRIVRVMAIVIVIVIYSC